MSLFFCPNCRKPFPIIQLCPDCNISTDSLANTYVEKLLNTVLSNETSREGMGVDVLTKWLHEPRATISLTMLLERKNDDPYPLVMGACGLGWLRDPAAVPVLERLLLDETQPYVARVAAEALGQIDGEESDHALEQAKKSPRSSVVDAANKALLQIEKEK
jgi:hypothetical protein